MSLDPGLLEKIGRLPPERRGEVEAFVDSLLGRLAGAGDGTRRSLKDLLLEEEPRSDSLAEPQPAARLTCRELVYFD